jgi:hypothetical protein
MENAKFCKLFFLFRGNIVRSKTNFTERWVMNCNFEYDTPKHSNNRNIGYGKDYGGGRGGGGQGGRGGRGRGRGGGGGRGRN